MKKNLLVLLLILTGISIANAQERVNATLPKINTIAKGKITEATGWILLDSGEWVSRKNRIPWNTDKKLLDYNHYTLGEMRENFTYIELREVTIKDSLYTILIKKYKDGFYKYESIREGWIPANSLDYYVFKTSELEKLKDLTADTSHAIQITTIYQKNIYYLDANSSLKTLEEDLYKIIQNGSPFTRKDLGVYIKLYKDKVRFIIDEFETSDYFIPDLDKKYYETTKGNFEKLFKL